MYGFDTGFVCYHRGWQTLRQEDLGFLWEHFVLNEIQGRLQTRQIRYWRDKRGHEVDFVLVPRGRPRRPAAIECGWSGSGYDPRTSAPSVRRTRTATTSLSSKAPTALTHAALKDSM